MPTQPIRTLQSKHFTLILTYTLAIALFAAIGFAQQLQRGISVQMATSSHATAMPEADNENAWIVTVTTDGRVFFGTEQVTPDELTEKMKMRPRNRDAKLYIKADADAPFQSVRQVLRSARTMLFDDAVLLTSQPEPSLPGTTVPPKGLEVWIGLEAGSNFVGVRIESREGSSTMKVDNEPVVSAELQGKMATLFDGRSGRIVLLKADDRVPYGQVVHAIDACRGAGASRVAILVATQI
jgi:biopolymer transport protein ExbD